MSSYNDDSLAIFMFVLVMAGIVFSMGLMVGNHNKEQEWKEWAVKNNYAGYNEKTGKLEKYGREYLENKLKTEFPELFKLFDGKIEEKTEILGDRVTIVPKCYTLHHI